MEDGKYHERTQPLRSVSLPNQLSQYSKVLQIPTYFDSSIGKDIILWDDILTVFKHASYVRNGACVVPFAKGSGFRNLEPLRIQANQDIIFDIVINGDTFNIDMMDYLDYNKTDNTHITTTSNKSQSR
ncbi:hypothetical protein BGZ76_007617, partial [Entomortierella beljakovae]